MLIPILLGCTPGPVAPPPPDPHPCDVDATGLVCTVAGTGDRAAGPDDLPARQVDLFLPTSVSFTPGGEPLLVDFNNHRIRVLGADGVLTTVAGNGVHAYAEEGADALQTGFENPISAAMAPDGTLYVQELHGCRILRVDPVTREVTTYAGSATNPGYPGYSGDGGPATEAELSEGGGIALGDDGTLYIADSGNHAIRKVTPDGVIDTVAGNGERGMVDGIGREARLAVPMDVAWHDGVLYVAEGANGAVRRIDLATGEVTTLAGTGSSGWGGDGGPAIAAQLWGPRGLGVGPDGAVYVADTENHVIRHIDPVDGTITAVLGAPGEPGFDGDGVPPEDARLDWPNDVAVSADGDVYVVDTFNDRLRAVVGGL